MLQVINWLLCLIKQRHFCFLKRSPRAKHVPAFRKGSSQYIHSLTSLLHVIGRLKANKLPMVAKRPRSFTFGRPTYWFTLPSCNLQGLSWLESLFRWSYHLVWTTQFSCFPHLSEHVVRLHAFRDVFYDAWLKRKHRKIKQQKENDTYTSKNEENEEQIQREKSIKR